MTARLKLENLLKVFQGEKPRGRRRQELNWGIMNKKMEGNNKWGGRTPRKKEQFLIS